MRGRDRNEFFLLGVIEEKGETSKRIEKKKRKSVDDRDHRKKEKKISLLLSSLSHKPLLSSFFSDTRFLSLNQRKALLSHSES